MEPSGTGLRRRLMRWYRTNGRHDLPWRQTRDPYHVLVSEVMLQQTQVERVIPYYLAWVERWPAVEDVAAASPADVIRAWGGLGYNGRAVRLHRACRAIADAGTFPRDRAALLELPGVGEYTAAAVSCFAFGQREAVVDTNVGRVVARVVRGSEAANVPSRWLTEAADQLLPRRDWRDHNFALMDLGALVCRARDPRCGECPLMDVCRSSAGGPRASKTRPTPTPRFELTARFARGRIVALLRDASAPLDEVVIAASLPVDHREKTHAYLDALRREGLVESRPSGYELAGQTTSMASPKL